MAVAPGSGVELIDSGMEISAVLVARLPLGSVGAGVFSGEIRVASAWAVLTKAKAGPCSAPVEAPVLKAEAELLNCQNAQTASRHSRRISSAR